MLRRKGRPGMFKLPPIPLEQRSFSGEIPRDRLRSAEPGRRDEATGLQPPRPGGDEGPRPAHADR